MITQLCTLYYTSHLSSGALTLVHWDVAKHVHCVSHLHITWLQLVNTGGWDNTAQWGAGELRAGYILWTERRVIGQDCVVVKCGGAVSTIDLHLH